MKYKTGEELKEAKRLKYHYHQQKQKKTLLN